MFQCPKCERAFTWAAKLEKHISNEHKLEPETLFVETQLDGIRPLCECGCGSHIPWRGWKLGFSSKFLRGHNASVSNAFANPELHAKAQRTRVKNIRDGKKRVWNKGLTVETDDRLARANEKRKATLREGYDSGRIVAPWTGKTKESCDALARASATKKKKYEEGLSRSWNKGLTRDTSTKIASIGDKISDTKRAQAKSADRFSPEEFVRIVEAAGFRLVDDPNDYRNKYQCWRVVCSEKGHVSEKSVAMLQSSPVCYVCHPKASKGQLEIAEFVRSLGVDIVLSDRSVLVTRDIDVFVPSHNFGIEFNGLFYHNEVTKRPTYHEEKTDLCTQKGVRLFHIFEDEWRDKRPVIKSMIMSRLGKLPTVIHARKCEVRIISPRERREFFERTHIDGDAKATVSWGLFFDNALVCALSLRKPVQRSKGNDVYELARFSCELNTSVVGGLGKLLEACKRWLGARNIPRLMTYVDKRHGDGHGYERVGFKLVGVTKNPRFWWTGGEVGPNRVDRFVYRADKTRGMSERQVASEARVHRIYGCRNKVYELYIHESSNTTA